MDDAGQISRYPPTKTLLTRRERLAYLAQGFISNRTYAAAPIRTFSFPRENSLTRNLHDFRVITIIIITSNAPAYLLFVCHCLGQVSSVGNILFKRFQSFYRSALSSSSPLVVFIFNDSCSLSYTFTGYNYMYGHDHLRSHSDHDLSTASLIRFIRHHFGFMSRMESFVYELSTS